MRNSRFIRLGRSRKKGMLLITTLLIIGFLTALTVGFIAINRDNLYFAQQTNGGQMALEAAYAGLNYAMMRFEQDANFGIDPQSATQANVDNNPSAGQYDAFPDGRPGGMSGNYGTPGGGIAIPYQKNYLTVYETGQTVLGLLSNGSSHFQIHFSHYPGTNCPAYNGVATTYSSNGFDDSSVQGNSFALWNHKQMAPNLHSLNNLNNGSSILDPGGKMIPAYTAHIVSIGYANGVTRVAEALLKRVFYSNSTISSASDISMHVLSSPAYGNGALYFTSIAPMLNNIQAGVQYNNSTKTFQITGANLNFYTDVNGSTQSTRVKFSTDNYPTYQGAGYALMPPGTSITDTTKPGKVQLINGVSYPNAGGQTMVSVGGVLPVQPGQQTPSGMLYAKAMPSQPLLPTDLNASNFYQSMNVTAGTDGNGLTVPVSGGGNNTYYVPAGIWSFRDQGTNPNSVDVYASNGAFLVTFTGTVKLGGQVAFTIKNYKLLVPPGVHLVVDSSASSVASGGNAEGNMMVTLSPKDFNSGNPSVAPTNIDSQGNTANPTIGLGYTDPSTLGNGAASLTLGGNLYLQGAVVGQGSVIAEAQTTAPANWVPSGGDWAGNPWAGWIVSNGSQVPPQSGDQGDLNFQGNSLLSKTPNASIGVYGAGNVTVNPIPAGGNSGNSLDASAFQTAMNNFAGGSGSGGYWDTTALPLPVNDVLNNWLHYADNPNATTAILRCSSCAGSSLEFAATGKTAVDLFGSSTNDQNVINYLANNISGSGCSYGAASCSIQGGALNLYQYKVLSDYASSHDTEWLTYTAPPSSGAQDAVETSIANGIRNYAMTENQPLGTYLNSSWPAGYQTQDMGFQGTIYTKGSTGYKANPSNYRFGLQGALISTRGGVEVDNAGQINFLFDPAQLSSLYQLSNGGNKVSIQWVTIW